MSRLLIPLLGIAVSCCASANMTVRLLPSLPSPKAVGTAIALLPRVDNAAPGMLVFRYSVSIASGPEHIVRDFSQQRDFVWIPALYEHDATVRVTVRNNQTKESAQGDLAFRTVSRIRDSAPAVTATANPLIALFSAPPCASGSRFRVALQRRGDEDLSYTPFEPCRGSASNNTYVAGMRADSDYRMRAEVGNGNDVKQGSWIPFHSGLLDGDFPPISVAVPRAAGVKVSEPVLIHSISSAGAGKRPFATDLDGNVIWYLRSSDFLTRILPGGRVLVLAEGANSANDMKRLQVLREMDLAGNVLRETNVARIAEQLESRGIHSDCKQGGKECVSGIHHEAIRLPNGHTMVIAGIERILPAGTQKSKEPVDVLGDLAIDLDEDFQVTAVWNAFDHMDLKRESIGNAKCRGGAGGGGCPPVFLAGTANGWLHSNSLNYIPATGDFLISMPEQNWVLKIDWRDGKGTGKILWRLGEDGDFTAKTTDPHPWFSYQHDPGFEPAGSNLISMLDDGHERKKIDPMANNRGQVWKLDEVSHTATLIYNADLGVYASALGSAQSLKNGGYSFDAGTISAPSLFARAVETSADGKVVYALQIEGASVYRSFRVADMYSSPGK